jgi:hypothetical protein
VDEDDRDEVETISSRFTERLFRRLLTGFPAGDTKIRYSSCQIVALSIGCISEIE